MCIDFADVKTINKDFFCYHLVYNIIAILLHFSVHLGKFITRVYTDIGFSHSFISIIAAKVDFNMFLSF